MAKYHYDLCGCEAIIRDVPMYDAALIDNGEFIMQNAANSGANKQEFITGYVDSSACMVNGLGISVEGINTDGSQGGASGTGVNYNLPRLKQFDTQKSIATPTATGQRWGKAIINPFAVYLTEYSQAAADDETATTNETADTTITMTAIEQAIDGGWIYSTHLSPISTERGQLRYVSAAAVNTLTYLTAATYTAASTTLIKILPINHELVDLTADGKSIATDLPASPVVALKVVQNYISPGTGFAGGKGRGSLDVLRHKLHDSTEVWGSGTRFYADLLITQHAYNKVV
jgi:hypothetical protein